ncbi:MAG: cupredoxin domain-containing protein [Patescibacteria group bacterium]
MQNKGLWLGLGIFMAVAIGGFFFLRRPSLAPPKEAVSGGKTTPIPLVEEGEDIREITIEASEYSFAPRGISLAKGEKVRLTFKNTGNLPHNLTIDELNLKTRTIAGGQEDTLEFIAEESGTFSFYCGVAGHRGLGMEGSLEVE